MREPRTEISRRRRREKDGGRRFCPLVFFFYMQVLGSSRFVSPIKLHRVLPAVRLEASAVAAMPGDNAVTTRPVLLFRQLFEKESSTYTYLVADTAHPDRPAVVIFGNSLFCSVFFFFFHFSAVNGISTDVWR